MEVRFGRDFSGVRIHRGAEANTLADTAHARAFTIGGSIFFRQGEFQPGTNQGKRLIAHELTHVLQQRAGMRSVQREVLARAPAARSTPLEPPSTAEADDGAIQRRALDGEEKETLERPMMAAGGQPAPATDAAEQASRQSRRGDCVPLRSALAPFLPGPLTKAVRMVAEEQLGVDLRGVRLDGGLTGQFQGRQLRRPRDHARYDNKLRRRRARHDIEGRPRASRPRTDARRSAAGARFLRWRGATRRRRRNLLPEPRLVPEPEEVASSTEVGEARRAERELAEASIAEPPTDLAEPAQEQEGTEQEATEQAKEDAAMALEPQAEPEETRAGEATDLLAPDPEALAAKEEEALTAEAAAWVVELEPPILDADTSPVVSEAASHLVTSAQNGIVQLRATAEQMRSGVSEATRSARDAIGKIVETNRADITKEFSTRRAAAVKQEVGAAAQAKTGLDTGKKSVEQEAEVSQETSKLGDKAATDAKTTARTGMPSRKTRRAAARGIRAVGCSGSFAPRLSSKSARRSARSFSKSGKRSSATSLRW